IPLPVQFYMHGDNFKKIFRRAKMHLLNAKTLIFDDDIDVFYKVKSVQIETAENIIKTFGEFTVNFTLDPFQYEIDSPEREITDEITLINHGYQSDPVITADV